MASEPGRDEAGAERPLAPVPPTLYVMIGVPGSGKTTYARTHLPNAIRISLDDLRLMMSGETYQERLEPAISIAAGALVQSLLPYCALRAWDVVFDATDVTRARRAPLVAAARAFGFRPVAIYIATALGLAHIRNRQRPFPVPGEVIGSFAHRLEPPTVEEGFDEVVVVKGDEPTTLPSCPRPGPEGIRPPPG